MSSEKKHLQCCFFQAVLMHLIDMGLGWMSAHNWSQIVFTTELTEPCYSMFIPVAYC